MDDETPATQIEQAHRPIFTLSSKPRVADRSDNPAHLYYGLANNNFVLLDLEKSKVLYESPAVHSHKIGCIRYKENILMTGGYDNFVKIFDPKTFQLVHTFQSTASDMQKFPASSIVSTKPNIYSQAPTAPTSFSGT